MKGPRYFLETSTWADAVAPTLSYRNVRRLDSATVHVTIDAAAFYRPQVPETISVQIPAECVLSDRPIALESLLILSASCPHKVMSHSTLLITNFGGKRAKRETKEEKY